MSLEVTTYLQGSKTAQEIRWRQIPKVKKSEKIAVESVRTFDRLPVDRVGRPPTVENPTVGAHRSTGSVDWQFPESKGFGPVEYRSTPGRLIRTCTVVHVGRVPVDCRSTGHCEFLKNQNLQDLDNFGFGFGSWIKCFGLEKSQSMSMCHTTNKVKYLVKILLIKT